MKWVFYVMLLKKDNVHLQRRCQMKFALEVRKLQWRWLGPYCTGPNITIGDILMTPWFHRMCVLKHYRDFEVPNTEEFEI